MRRTIASFALFGIAWSSLVGRAPAQAEWVQRPQLHARSEHAMVYDPAGGRVLLIGGTQWQNVYGTFRELWEHRAGRWSFVSQVPGELAQPSAAWDIARGLLFVYGERTRNYSQLQSWNGAQWTSIALPLNAIYAATIDLVYDPSSNATLLVATHLNPALVEVYQWNGAAFVLRSSGSGPAWGDAHWVHDPVSNRLLRIGAAYGGSAIETWAYAGNAWQQIATSNTPPALFSPAVAFDAAGSRVLLFGGYEIVNTFAVTRDGTWALSGTSWQQLSPATSPTARVSSAMAHDASRSEIVLFGGHVISSLGQQWTGDTWVWNGVDWSLRDGERSPSNRFIGATAFDERRRRSVAVAWYANLTSTWELDGERWRASVAAPQPPYDGVAAFDRTSGLTLLVGLNGTTWSWDGSAWTMLTTAGVPTSSNHAIAWDGSALVLVEGGMSGFPASMWRWSGSAWTPIPGALLPPGDAPRLAYDERRDRLVLVYGAAHYGGPSIVYEWDRVAWSAVTSSGFSGRSRFAFGYHAARGRVVLAGGEFLDPFTQRTSYFRDAYEWDGVSWTALPFLPYPGSTYLLGGSLLRTPADELAWVGASSATYHGALETYELRSTRPAEVDSFGAGCGSGVSMPRFDYQAWQRPWIGELFSQRVLGLPAAASVLALGVGSSRDAWNGLRLPIDLGSAGFTGCSLLVGLEELHTLAVVGGSAAWTLPIPRLPVLIGAELYEQVFVPDPAANPGGLATSAGLHLKVGVR